MNQDETHTEAVLGETKLTEEELLEILAEQERTIKELRWKLWRYDFLVSKTAVIANYLTLGPGLTHAMERWEREFQKGKGSLMNRVPRRETFEVAAAYLRRRAISGLAIGFLAVIPSAMTVFLLWQQNKKIDLQILMASASQARESQGEISALASDVADFAGMQCIRGDLKPSDVAAYVSEFETRRTDSENWNLPVNRCWAEQRLESPLSRRDWLDKVPGFMKNRAAHIQKFNIDSSNDNKYHSGLLSPDYLLGASLPLPRDMQQRLSTLSTSLRPYRMVLDKTGISQSPRLTRNLYSPEKGTLLRALGANAVSITSFNGAQAWAPTAHLPDLTWTNSSLANAMAECANLSGGRFINTDFSGGRFVLARFDYADLMKVSGWSQADFTNASFRGAILPEANKFDVASLDGVDLDGAIVPSRTWHEDLPPRLSADVQRPHRPQEVEISYNYHPLVRPEEKVKYGPPGAVYETLYWVMERSNVEDWRNERDAQCSRRVGEGFQID